MSSAWFKFYWLYLTFYILYRDLYIISNRDIRYKVEYEESGIDSGQKKKGKKFERNELWLQVSQLSRYFYFSFLFFYPMHFLFLQHSRIERYICTKEWSDQVFYTLYFLVSCRYFPLVYTLVEYLVNFIFFK